MKTLLFTPSLLCLLMGLSIPTSQADEKKPAAADEKKPIAEEKKPAAEAEKHDHDHSIKAGPTGGRLLTDVEPHVEFFVTKEKKVEIRFIDDANKVLAPDEQVITVTLGDRANPTKLTFTKDGDKLVSNAMVPDGNDYPTVVSIKTDAKAKTVNAKFNLNMTKCPTCPNAEYACTCDHDHDHDHSGHEHKEGEKHDHKEAREQNEEAKQRK
jgi:ABC-type Zn2+ transport system substrate-binding protein/surface adhesin